MAVHNNSIEINELISIINASRRTIITFIVLALISAIFYLMVTAPRYRVDALLQVDDKSRSFSVFAETSELMEANVAMSDKVQILKSRSVLETAVEEMRLNIVARPVYFPVVGKALARQITMEIDGYATGNEVIRIDEFSVPDVYLDKEFTLVAKGNGEFDLFDPNEQNIGNGKVGAPMEVDQGQSKPIILTVGELSSKPGKSFIIKRRPILKVVNELKNELVVEESKDVRGAGPKVGLIKLTLTGGDPDKTARILNAIIDSFLEQNLQQKFSNANNTIGYLERQLVEVELKLESAEAALNTFRLKQGSIDLSRETATVLDRIVIIESELSDLKREREELLQLFTPQHTKLVAIDAKINSLNNELQKHNQKTRALPSVQQEMLRLTRDVEVTRSLYTLMLNKVQELKVVKAGADGDINVIDYAVAPLMPEYPKTNLVLMLSLIMGSIMGVAKILFIKSINPGLDDPEVIESQLGINVVAVVPNSGRQEKIKKIANRNDEADCVLASAASNDYAIESIRNLRTTLDFIHQKVKNNIVLITGPSSGVGKSFVSSNLGVIWANANKKVLVVDADFRRGVIHQCFGVERIPGLSSVITGDFSLDNAILRTRTKNLYVLPAGGIPDKPSELLLDSRLNEILKACSERFDHIIIDSPPVLGLSDASILAQKSGITLLVLKEGYTSLREVKQTIKNLQQTGVTPYGVVFNNMQISKNRYGYGKYYGYAYKGSSNNS